MAKFKKAIQIGRNVTDIINLPCVTGCFKATDKAGYEWLMYKVRIGLRTELAEESDWLCRDDKGRWHVLSKELYQAMAKGN